MQFGKGIPYGKLSIRDIIFQNFIKDRPFLYANAFEDFTFYKVIQSYFKDKYEQKITEFNKVQYKVYNFLTNKY